jgi:hypothetical protein
VRKEDVAYLQWVARREQLDRDSSLVSYLMFGVMVVFAALSALL